MDRLRRLVQRQPARPEYEPLTGPNERDEGGEGQVEEEEGNTSRDEFSWVVYSIFLLLGVAMLWAWNMFLAAAPYFQRRFKHNDWILIHFQSAIISCSTITNLGSVLILTHLQSKASYPKRIISSLVLNIFCFTLLALSTVVFRHVTPTVYFAFLMLMVFAASLATGLCQNGVFAYVSGFGRPEYTQSIMTGQAIAGVLPCIAEIALVLSVPSASRISEVQDSPGTPPTAIPGQASSKSAFAYFLTATGVSAIALIAFLYLLTQSRSLQSHNNNSKAKSDDSDNDHDQEDGHSPTQQTQRSISLLTLFQKLHWLALAVFACFAITMVFPVFTQAILSVHPPTSPSTPRILHPESFIPLAFLLWNTGDLLGRLLTLIPQRTTQHPRTLFVLSLLRILFIPAYLTCNLHGRGARLINSDFVYLFVVQLGFGLTNGWLGSSCMMGAARWVQVHEREAAGGFMGLMLVAGLTVGSLASFAVAQA